MPPDLLALLKDFGLPGITIAVVAWVIIRALPHIKDGIVQDRKNRRAHELALRKLEDQIQKRRPTQRELPYDDR
jgi:hypothetical protein